MRTTGGRSAFHANDFVQVMPMTLNYGSQFIMPPPTKGGGRRHYVFELSVRLSEIRDFRDYRKIMKLAKFSKKFKIIET